MLNYTLTHSRIGKLHTANNKLAETRQPTRPHYRAKYDTISKNYIKENGGRLKNKPKVTTKTTSCLWSESESLG